MKTRAITAGVLGLALAAFASTAALAWDTHTTRSLNVRQGPGLGYPVMFTLPPNTYVNVDGCNGNWCWYSAGRGAIGWLSARYLASGAPGPRPYPRFWPGKPVYPWPGKLERPQ